MAPADDPAFHQAMDQLMLQVDIDNVVAVHGAFKQHAVNLRSELKRLRLDTRIGLCGKDPVSPDAADSFNAKIDQLVAVHWTHLDELEAVAEHLAAAARHYGKSEEEIASSFSEKPTR